MYINSYSSYMYTHIYCSRSQHVPGWWWKYAVQGQDLLPSVCAVKDSFRWFCGSGDHAIHETTHLPGDGSGGVIVLHVAQVSYLKTKVWKWQNQVQRPSTERKWFYFPFFPSLSYHSHNVLLSLEVVPDVAESARGTLHSFSLHSDSAQELVYVLNLKFKKKKKKNEQMLWTLLYCLLGASRGSSTWLGWQRWQGWHCCQQQ